MTIKERLFVKFYFESLGSGAQSVRRSGYATKNPRQVAWQLLQKKHISDILNKKFKEIGLD